MIFSPQYRLALLCMLSALAAFAGIQGLAWARAGLFEYPLDDVYIHLAMAEGIAGGNYGLNPGEPASAASSVLYPLLLLPFPGTEIQRLLPLFWNGAALAALGWLFGRALTLGGAGGRAGVAMALLGPLATNMAGVAYLGMEHTLHALVSLILLVELWRFLQDGRISAGFVAAVILGPLFRFEGLVPSLLATGMVFFAGRRGAGLALAAASVLPVAVFSAFLLSQGLDALPSSVLAKSRVDGALIGPLVNLVVNLLSVAGLLVSLALALTFVLAQVLRRRGHHRTAALLAVASAAAVIHLCVGQIGWLYRYEHYLLVLMGGALALSFGRLPQAARFAVGIAGLAGAGSYGAAEITTVAWNSRAVHLQHAQMLEIARRLPGEPVAANDIGRLAWARDGYVLDLWGLASAEARHLRRPRDGAAPAPGWAGVLTARHSVRYAMIYDRWIDGGIGRDWVPVARLEQRDPRGQLGSLEVSIYAADPDFAPALRAALQAVQPKLAAGAELTELPLKK